MQIVTSQPRKLFISFYFSLVFGQCGRWSNFWSEGAMTKVTNGDIGGKVVCCHFCSDVVFERPLSKTGLNIFPATL